MSRQEKRMDDRREVRKGQEKMRMDQRTEESSKEEDSSQITL